MAINGKGERERAPISVVVAIPTHDSVPAGFMYDFARLCAYTGLAVEQGLLDLNISMVQGTYVHTARQQLAEMALEQGATHVLWLDSDMRFPKDSLLRLLKHGKPIVGVNYSTRGVPAHFVGIKRVAVDSEDEGARLVTGPDSTGLEEVEALGFGMVLMRTSVLASMGEPPWFFFQWLPNEKHRQVGEDVYFCRKARAAGWKVFADHDLSKEIAHVGSFEYRVDHAQACVEEAEKAKVN